MDEYSDSTDRTPAELVLFAMAFVGFLLAVGGVILGSTGLALVGALILLLAVSRFRD